MAVDPSRYKPSEDERAEGYRQQARNRAVNDRARRAALGGNREARKDLADRWQALQDWLRERRG